MNSDSAGEWAAIAGAFSKISGSFLNAQIPRVLLDVPGCHEIFVNRSHKKLFGNHFRTVFSESEADRILQNATFSLSGEEDYSNVPCYCWTVASIVALNAGHCYIEKNYQTLLKTSSEEQQDIAAFLSSQKGSREYELCLARLRLVSTGAIEVELQKIGNLKIEVRTTKFDGKMPLALEAETFLDGEPYIPMETADISSKRGYVEVYKAFAQALEKLEKQAFISPEKQGSVLKMSHDNLLSDIEEIKQELLKVLITDEQKRDLIDYEAVKGFVNGIYGCSPCEDEPPKTILEVLTNMKETQERLFDANIVVDQIITKLRAEIVNAPYVGV